MKRRALLCSRLLAQVIDLTITPGGQAVGSGHEHFSRQDQTGSKLLSAGVAESLQTSDQVLHDDCISDPGGGCQLCKCVFMRLTTDSLLLTRIQLRACLDTGYCLGRSVFTCLSSTRSECLTHTLQYVLEHESPGQRRHCTSQAWKLSASILSEISGY